MTYLWASIPNLACETNQCSMFTRVTAWRGNAFCIIISLWGDTSVTNGVPSWRASNAKLWCFIMLNVHHSDVMTLSASLSFCDGNLRVANGFLSQWAPCQIRKLRVVHVPGMFSPPPRVSDPDMHHGTCVTHVPWCMLGSLTSGFLWSRWQGKCSRHSQRMRNPQFYISGKRPMGQ